MRDPMALAAEPAQCRLFKHALATLALLTLAACGGNGDTGNVNQPKSARPANAPARVAELPAQPEPTPSMPAVLSEDEQRPLLEAIARSYPRIRQLETKERTGQVRALDPATERANLERARADLASIKRNLARLSGGGLPTYALIHDVARDGRLDAWVVFPDGGVVAGVTQGRYSGLGALQDGLGVTRIAETRGPQLIGEEKPRLDAERAAGIPKDTPESIKKRDAVLAETAATLLPGDIRKVLAAGQGRLLVVPVGDTGTAPYAALPIRNPDDFAARRWSFVVMQDLNLLAGGDNSFDMGKVDLAKSVIVGDPENTVDTRFSFPPLPGARKEAQAIAGELGVDPQDVFIGATATRQNVVRAINRNAGQGVIYMATHAVADPDHPLTRGFVVLGHENLFAGELRTQKFRGWDKRRPLVVMSACQTALGRVFDGGTFGVARTWANAGAGQVVASLWNVSDHATYLLMTRFVAGLQQGKAPELAMQAAQLETLKDYPNNPKMWASFTIIGKPTLGSSSVGKN